MEVFQMILGIAMFYSWIHGTIIVCKKIENLTKYEKGLLIFGVVMLGLFIIGSL